MIRSRAFCPPIYRFQQVSSTCLQHRVISTIRLIRYFTTTDRPSLSFHNTLRYSFTRPIIDTVPSALYFTSEVMPESIILRACKGIKLNLTRLPNSEVPATSMSRLQFQVTQTSHQDACRSGQVVSCLRSVTCTVLKGSTLFSAADIDCAWINRSWRI